MIEELRIRDLGVIADATLPLGPGFTAITGETGAGKTMVVTALGLLMGARADSGAVRRGADAARVGGLILTDTPEIAEIVADAGGEIDDGELALTRTVSAEGRSRATVGGVAAPVGSLTRLAERLFAVHGQSEQLRLRSASAQREMLDRFGGDSLRAHLDAYRAVHRERRALTEQLAHLTHDRDARAGEAARLRSEVEEIAAADPQPGEAEELRQRIDRLSNLEELRAATANALQAVTSESGDPFAGDAVSLVDAALREVEKVSTADQRLAAVAEQLREVSYRLGDVSRELTAVASDLDDAGPEELAAANERLALLNALIRNYGDDASDGAPGTDAVLAYAARAAVRLAELDGDDELVPQLEERVRELAARERELADSLSAARQAAATELAEQVTAELAELALPDARLTVAVTPAELGAWGGDEVQLLLQPHRGAEPRPLAKGASGGELSRVMLALEVVVAASDPVPTFVFDEVDAGVGGAAAIEIGRRLARLARTSQVIVVTHLAQVAAFANNHLHVSKDASGEFTSSSCVRLDGSERLGEMARLLSGLTDSQSALEHAAELLELGAASA